jgi:hypothetical protein
MNRTRLAAAAGVAALTLGATVAVAETDPEANQAVTITVTAIERSVTAGGSATISITAGQDADEAEVDGEPTLAYSNGDAGTAEINATITQLIKGGVTTTDPNRNDLFNAFGAETNLLINTPNVQDTKTLGTLSAVEGGAATPIGDALIVSDISTDVIRSATAVEYSLSGGAPVTVGTFALTVTFTIADN